MLYGLEKEFFVVHPEHNNDPLMVDTKIFGSNYDESGLLVECRGKPFNNIVEAVFSLKADIWKVEKLAASNNLSLSDNPVMIVSRKTKLQVQRNFVKGLSKYQNLYNYESHRNNLREHTAGIHISFTNPQTIYSKEGNLSYNGLFDYIHLFKYLDHHFSREIRESKRNPGFYEIKTDGRIEYRSLPANVNLDKVINVILNYKEK
jgi:hypothetical protein